MEDNLAQVVGRAFHHRYTGEAKKCLDDYRQVFAALGLSGSESLQVIGDALTVNPEHEASKNAILALRLSVERLRAGPASSLKLLSDPDPDQSRSFQINLELGLNELAIGHNWKALGFFSKAQDVSDCALSSFIASFNRNLCLENLGLLDKSAVQTLEESLRALGPDQKSGVIARQPEAMILRFLFRQGQLTELRTRLLSLSEPYLDQLTYYRRWLNDLPYVRHAQATEAPPSCDSALQYQGTFRLRTLLSLQSQEDLEDGPFSSLVERFYLWVWRWLEDPDVSLLRRIQRLASAIAAGLPESCSNEESMMLCNGMEWLLLFSGRGLALSRSFKARLQSPGNVTILPLEAESALLKYLFALRAGDDLSIKDCKTYLEHVYGAFLKNECPAIASFFDPGSQFGSLASGLSYMSPQAIDNCVLVDGLSHEVILYRKGDAVKSLISRDISALLFTLKGESRVNIEDILLNCFGIGHYDPLTHDPKLANLLLRANKVMPEGLFLSRKGGQVLGRGDFGLVHFRRWTEHSRQLDRYPIQVELQQEQASINSPGSLPTRPTWVFNRWIQRRDFQECFTLSRSKAVRILNDLLEKNAIQRRGQGKSSRYFIPDDVRESILETTGVQI